VRKINRKPLTVNVTNLALTVGYIVLAILTSIASAYRDDSIGDTVNYADAFMAASLGYERERWEGGYKLWLDIISSLSDDPKLYFFLHTFMVVIAFFVICRLISSKLIASDVLDKNKIFRVLISTLPIFLYSSSWFVSSTINGLRQGFSLPFLYIGITLLISHNYRYALCFFLMACSLHISNVLLIPFIMIFWLKPIFLISAVVIGMFAYVTQFNAIIVQVLSNLLLIDAYSEISEYGTETGNFYGFNASFFIYSIFWIVAPLALTYISKNKEVNKLIVSMTKVYALLLLPFLYFGFAAYVNRYAVIAWFFLPVLQTVVFSAVFNFRRSLILVGFITSVVSAGIYSFTVISI